MKAVYGPVSSWRLGRSLGVDSLCTRMKTCSFDCTYCQLGKTAEKTLVRRKFIGDGKLRRDLEDALPETRADVVTFSGAGEPTLANNLASLIDVVRRLTDLPIAILTNSTLMCREDVRGELDGMDILIAKLDAPDQKTFEQINRPVPGLLLEDVIDGIKQSRKAFRGLFALQMMFIKENMGRAEELAAIAREIQPDEVQLNTPLRPCPVKPLSPEEMAAIERRFDGLKTVSVYKSERPKTHAIDKMEVFRRRGIIG